MHVTSDDQYKASAQLLFEQIAEHKFEEVPSWEELWSTHSNTIMFEFCQALCTHFQIDMAKMQAFIKTNTPCDYCGERTGDVEKVDGENICKHCLEKTE